MHTKTMDYRVEDEQLVGLNKSLYQKRHSGNITGTRFYNKDFASAGQNLAYPNVPLKNKVSEKNRQNFEKLHNKEHRPPVAAFHSNQNTENIYFNEKPKAVAQGNFSTKSK